MINWLFPTKCPVCGDVMLPRHAQIHIECKQRLPYIDEPICKHCGRPVADETQEYCEFCATHPANDAKEGWDIGRSIYLYQEDAVTLIHRLKQEGTRETVSFLAGQMIERQGNFLRHLNPDCFVPVPLYSAKKRQRGFNQAELLAGELAKEWKKCNPTQEIPMRTLLCKDVPTADQKSLSAAERARNLSHVFSLRKMTKDELPDTVLLIDDVVTTQSTIRACASVLKKGGVRRVGFLCVCLNAQEHC